MFDVKSHLSGAPDSHVGRPHAFNDTLFDYMDYMDMILLVGKLS